MRQITLLAPGQFSASEVASPAEAPGQALVRVRRVGVCGTDWHAFAGRQPFFTYPRVLGHELAVEIVAVPDNTPHLHVGARCAVEPYLSCGQCHSCRRGKPNCCMQLRVLGVHTDGGMCDLLSVPIERLYPSTTLSDDQLALVETLGIGYHAVERGAVTSVDRVLIVGAGPIGLAVVQFALPLAEQVELIEPNPVRRDFAERMFAAAPHFRALPAPAGTLHDVVFDATGSPTVMAASFAHVAFGGRLVFVGIVQADITFDDVLFHRRELTLLGSRNSAGAFPPIMAAIANGQIDTTSWITHRLNLAEVPAQLPLIGREPTLIKTMIAVD
jgi:2-desacetyl-2-hydroxyethyl bacteriochlorophyllide A dehydrogenase